jgi:hypothetical protein
VESFLYDVKISQAALEDLKLEYATLGQRITPAYSLTAVSGGESASKPEQWTMRREWLQGKIDEHERVLRRYKLVLNALANVSKGARLIFLLRLKYLKGYDNEPIAAILGVDIATYHRDRIRVIDIVHEVLPSQFKR